MNKLVTNRIRPSIGALLTAKKEKEEGVGAKFFHLAFIPGLISQESQYHPPFLTDLTHMTPTSKRIFKSSQKYRVRDDIFKQCFHPMSEPKFNDKSEPKTRNSRSKSGHLPKDSSNLCYFYDKKRLRKLLLNTNLGMLEFPRSTAAIKGAATGVTKVISSLERRLSCSEKPCERKGKKLAFEGGCSLGDISYHHY